jgi:hypothetical protein
LALTNQMSNFIFCVDARPKFLARVFTQSAPIADVQSIQVVTILCSGLGL